MNRYYLISLVVLLAFVVALPVYALNEPLRMQQAQVDLREQTMEDGARLYLDICGTCHGSDGAGLGMTPPLNHPALTEADPDFLFTVIARAAHGTTMAAWHVEEGGILSDYQISQLVSVIQYADWDQVEELALDMDFQEPELSDVETSLAYLESELEEDPHRCVACHEDPEVHFDKFGLNCARCHSTVAWTPALLTKHTFYLDHGSVEDLECQVCHVENYYSHTCYECHDHTPEDMETVHLAEDIPEYQNCMECHPTGQPDEARKVMLSKIPEVDSIIPVHFLDLAQPISIPAADEGN